jgi:NADH dehydrogenase FAD-containing subunit
MVLEDQLAELGVQVMPQLVVEEITDGAVVARDGEGRQQLIAADSVVLAPILASRDGIVEQLATNSKEVHIVGDCKRPRILYNAIHDGFEAALKI